MQGSLCLETLKIDSTGRIRADPVLTKQDFTRRYAANEFGNASPTWQTIGEFLSSEASKNQEALFHLRNREAAGETFYNQSARDIIWKWSSKNMVNWYCSAMCPTEWTQLQGEVQQSIQGFGDRKAGLDLLFTTVAKPMREALAERSEQVSGVIASEILRQYLCPNSLEWLEILLERYPGHVIEFTALDHNWGTVPGYNTIFWECRAY